MDAIAESSPEALFMFINHNRITMEMALGLAASACPRLVCTACWISGARCDGR